MKSIGFRFLIVGVLTVLMFIPVFLAGEVINSRAQYSRSTVNSLSGEWGGQQLLSGPQIAIPVEGPVTRIEKRDVVAIVNDKEVIRQKDFEVTEVQRKDSVYAYPEDFDLNLTTTSEERARGIFKVPVFVAETDVRATFDFEAIAKSVQPDEKILWDHAELRVTLKSNKALRGKADLTADGRVVPMEPLIDGDSAGIVAALGDPRNINEFQMKLGFNGAGSFQVTPVGRNTSVQMQSDWPHPSFTGTFLPDTREVREDGFDATWLIPHLARTVPQISRFNADREARYQTAFGVDFFRPNDFYHKAYRAARYGILFIALTFLTVLLIEDRSGRGTHPVQYIFIGLAQSTFVLLMVAYSEQIGFARAYTLSAGATILLLTMFGFMGLKLGRRSLVLGCTLILLYAVLYLILRSADYALLAGSTLAFGALAGTMYLTRNESWYGEPRSGGGWFKRAAAPMQAAAPRGNG